jgi:hypothetical protein
MGYSTVGYTGVSNCIGSPMPLTLTLPPKIEALLRQRAEISGQDLATVALALLTVGLSLNGHDFLQSLEGIQNGLDDFEQGRFCSFDAFIAEQNQKYSLSLEA